MAYPVHIKVSWCFGTQFVFVVMKRKKRQVSDSKEICEIIALLRFMNQLITPVCVGGMLWQINVIYEF